MVLVSVLGDVGCCLQTQSRLTFKIQVKVVGASPGADIVDFISSRINVAGRYNETGIISVFTKSILPGVTGVRSPALTTYDTGPIAAQSLTTAEGQWPEDQHSYQ